MSIKWYYFFEKKNSFPNSEAKNASVVIFVNVGASTDKRTTTNHCTQTKPSKDERATKRRTTLTDRKLVEPPIIGR